MDEHHVELLKVYIDAKVDPLIKDVVDIRLDVKELKAFRWKVTGLAIAASSFAGSATFGLAKVLEQLFAA